MAALRRELAEECQAHAETQQRAAVSVQKPPLKHQLAAAMMAQQASQVRHV